MNIESIILRWARIRDELKRYDYHLPDPEKGLVVVRDAPEIPEKFQSLPIRKLLQKLAENPGQTTRQIMMRPLASVG